MKLSVAVVPVTAEAEVEVSVGTALSITIALFAPSDPAAPGDARVKVAAAPSEVATIVPLLSPKEVVAA